ncbi:MAG: DegT/DnrJ/EryC1/StrS family aminotransferase [FCB group bacterium]|jgi:dTDP-4-amino-4,6-dideoxygalactose transaminase|nr:DegT/DnrJ/EryC1/StrS family aminotransferase [FCB group bacterium]
MAELLTDRLAIHGGAPVRAVDKSWPQWPIVGDEERRALLEVFNSGKWWYGERVAQFEAAYALFQDARFCVTCNSGTAAAEIGIQALGFGPGDEVIVPAYTFIATASSVARMGATPVFVDVDESWCIDPAAVEAAITPRTKAIVPVHFGSRVADMDRLNALADKHGLVVMEDACHSWGSKWKGKGTGALGRCGVFSFQMSKNMTAGEGGAILTDDEELADRCRAISNCGRSKGGAWYGHDLIGTNARMTEFAAAVLSAQLERLEEQTLYRERMGAILNEELAGVEGLVPQPGDERMTRRAYHLYPFRLDEKAFGCSRERFVEAARAEGMSLTAGYPVPLYNQPVFERLRGDTPAPSCPVTEDLCTRSGVWFNHSQLLSPEEDIRLIAKAYRKIKDHVSELA